MENDVEQDEQSASNFEEVKKEEEKKDLQITEERKSISEESNWKEEGL